ncbi:MAG: glycosyltransferase family 39 protein [Bryobacteraceae bacterium]|nr:glycosyltransferase family 39 protein [Bryobacteraceae bacterium]
MSDAEPRSRPFPTLLLVALAALICVSFYSLALAGLIGPDEPRYASIGRAMATSGDWVTPRLWGAPWFEKPALLYWLIGAAHSLGLRAEWAARLPVALCGALFACFFWWALRKLKREAEAPVAAVLLASCAGWMAVGNVAATDMPLAASFNAALLSALLWLQTERRRWAVAAGAFLGLALLAKGLVGAVLFLPLLWFARKRLAGLALLFSASAAVALPWYIAVTLRNGTEFLRVFFWEHHFGRFARPDLQHVQPFWFYAPVLLGLLFPWTPLLALVRRSTLKDVPERVFAAVAVFGFVFFSASTNKLPGYLLPLLPPVCVLLARAVLKTEAPKRTFAACGLLLALIPLAAAVLPETLHSGLRHVSWSGAPWLYCGLAVPVGAAVYWLARRRAMTPALALLALVSSAGWLYIKVSALPVVDQVVSARPLWGRVQAHRGDTCVETLNRALRYGLNYYSVTPLPDCAASPTHYRIRQDAKHDVQIVPAETPPAPSPK